MVMEKTTKMLYIEAMLESELSWFLRYKYESGESVRDICSAIMDKTGIYVSPASISRWLRIFGIPTREFNKGDTDGRRKTVAV